MLRSRRHWIVPFSLLLWLAHLFQIWLFTVALSTQVPFFVCASLSAVALMAGQMPFTLAGLGPDAAVVSLPDLRGRAPMHFGAGPGLTYRPQGVAATGWHTLDLRLKSGRATISARRGYAK